jgi:hypothetical protein
MVRMVCESVLEYMCKLVLYDSSSVTLQDTVLELLNPNLQQGYTVSMDGYYNSVCIARQLHEQGTGDCRIITQNRG